MTECDACGDDRVLVDGLCGDCEWSLFESPESAYVTRAAIAWRKAGCPVDMSDPWDTSIVSEELAPMRPHVDAWAQMLGYADPNMVAQMKKEIR